MSCINCSRVGKRCCSLKGVRIKLRRFSVYRLRAKLLYVLKLFTRLKSCYRKASRLMRINRTRRRSDEDDHVMMRPPMYNQMRRPLTHSNSFCAAAIADCVDFIKRNSVSVDDDKTPMLNR